MLNLKKTPARRPVFRQAAEPANTVEAADRRLDWWRAACFGAFVHWGPASLSGQDISWCRRGDYRRGDHQTVHGPGVPADEYDQLYKRFNAERFNAREWVEIFQSAGMKYLVFTAKHHDGFCLFDSRHTDYKSTAADCPAGRDFVREIADACHASGMKLGIYYSARDWYHPDYLTENHGRYLAYYHSQLLELLSNYGKIDILWFDHIGGSHAQWDPGLVMKTVRALQPDILINDRLHASVQHGKLAAYIGDFDTPEQKIGKYQTDRPWESCLCLVGGVWSYKPDGVMMSLEECVQALARCAGGDGNLLLNTGPTPDGCIEPRQAQRLTEIGAWLKANGRSIYGTRGGPLPPDDWGVSTQRGQTIYLHLLHFDGEVVRLPALPGRIARARFLNGADAKTVQSTGATLVHLPPEQRQAFDTIIELTME